MGARPLAPSADGAPVLADPDGGEFALRTT
ncbi:hypothetical protein [Euzebya sp.]